MAVKKSVQRIVGWMIVLTVLLTGFAASAQEKDLAVTPGLDPAWENILLLGTDTRPGETVGRTDTMIILSVNREEKSVRLTSLMRDMWVDIYGTNHTHKINAANVFGGADAAMATVNRCFGMNIEEYVLVDMDGLTEIINLIGGIDVAVTGEEAKQVNRLIKEENMKQQEKVEAGESVHLTGEQAMAFSRIRDIGDDRQRTERQRIVLMAMAGKIKETSVWNLMRAVATGMGFVKTNLSLGQVIDLGMTALDIDLDGITQLRIPQDGAYRMGKEEKSGLDVIWADFEKNKEILHEFIYGE